MHNDCLLEIYNDHLLSEARQVFPAIAQLESASMENLMIHARLTTNQVRRGVWGLACTGLIIYKPGAPVVISDNGRQLAKLLALPGNPGNDAKRNVQI